MINKIENTNPYVHQEEEEKIYPTPEISTTPMRENDIFRITTTQELSETLEEIEGRSYKVYDGKPLPRFKILILTFTAFALGLSWALLIGNTSPMLRRLGFPEEVLTYGWIVGPLLAVFTKILFGVISDRITWKIGRRRIFMLIGTILLVISFIVFSAASDIASILHRYYIGITSYGWIAVVSFWFIHFSIFLVESPFRALVADVIPPSQQVLGNSHVSTYENLGRMVGFFMASMDLVALFPFFQTNLLALYFIISFLVALGVIITVFWIDEKQFLPKRRRPNVFRQFIDTVRDTPSPVWRASLVQFFTFITWFMIFILFTTWFGISISGGDPKAPERSMQRTRFDVGVQSGILGLICMSMVSIPYSLILPNLIKWSGVKVWWYVGLSILAVGCGLSPIIVDGYVAFVLAGFFGIAFATTLVIPWSIVNAAISDKLERGTYIALFELTVSIPCIIMGIISGIIMRYGHLELRYLMSIGAIPAIIALILIYWTDVSPIEQLKPQRFGEETEVLLGVNNSPFKQKIDETPNVEKEPNFSLN